MFYWGYGCEKTSDGIYTDRYPWMKCLDPTNFNETTVPMGAEPVTDAQIEMANAILNGECMYKYYVLTGLGYGICICYRLGCLCTSSIFHTNHRFSPLLCQPISACTTQPALRMPPLSKIARRHWTT